ncbi:hypothetical protein ANN_23105 [Periplaneta americana]|uniref:Uncharacterized protein n=1 Tax=Periplaneta americana TaxID=6978 RepID=A0ABQ8SKL0_PERAM|nr:hypothetical protein ANN_23105 [Periplaneta americana]
MWFTRSTVPLITELLRLSYVERYEIFEVTCTCSSRGGEISIVTRTFLLSERLSKWSGLYTQLGFSDIGSNVAREHYGAIASGANMVPRDGRVYILTFKKKKKKKKKKKDAAQNPKTVNEVIYRDLTITPFGGICAVFVAPETYNSNDNECSKLELQSTPRESHLSFCNDTLEIA